ncbi:MAG: MBL fold metallo-hydrolase [Deltaproteobacteria bacterium]|nr:MBL fold metallo-hydrolase [Deltaproteobacteria bacterium]
MQSIAYNNFGKMALAAPGIYYLQVPCTHRRWGGDCGVVFVQDKLFGNKAYFIDVGDGDDGVKIWRWLGMPKIEAAIITHWHSDHCGGFHPLSKEYGEKHKNGIKLVFPKYGSGDSTRKMPEIMNALIKLMKECKKDLNKNIIVGYLTCRLIESHELPSQMCKQMIQWYNNQDVTSSFVKEVIKPVIDGKYHLLLKVKELVAGQSRIDDFKLEKEFQEAALSIEESISKIALVKVIYTFPKSRQRGEYNGLWADMSDVQLLKNNSQRFDMVLFGINKSSVAINVKASYPAHNGNAMDENELSLNVRVYNRVNGGLYQRIIINLGDLTGDNINVKEVMNYPIIKMPHHGSAENCNNIVAGLKKSSNNHKAIISGDTGNAKYLKFDDNVAKYMVDGRVKGCKDILMYKLLG